MNELGARAGVSHGTIGHLENGRSPGKPSTVGKIAEALGCSKNWLLTGNGDPFPGVPETSKEAIRRRVLALIGDERIDHFAERAGVDMLDAIGLVTDGAVPVVKTEMIKMAQALGSTLEWVVAGIGEPRVPGVKSDIATVDRLAISDVHRPPVVTPGMTCVPFLDPMAKSDWARGLVPQLAGTDKELHFPAGIVPEGCFALMVRSATMAPKINTGDILVVAPVDPSFMGDGDYVVVTSDGSLSVRQVRVLGEGWELSNANPEMPEKAIAGELRRAFRLVMHCMQYR